MKHGRGRTPIHEFMRVIAKSRLRSFWESHKDRADAMRALSAWYKIASHAEWTNFASLRQTFASADQVGNCTVFDVGNNRYRLIGRVIYPHRIYVLRVMDHREYDRASWIDQCGCHTPRPRRQTDAGNPTPARKPASIRRKKR